MKLPTKVRVGCCDYKIEQVVVESDEDYVGRCHPNQQRIEIDKRLPIQKKIQTLFHEVLHAICFENGNLKLSEQKTDIIASGIVSMLRDNPKLKELV